LLARWLPAPDVKTLYAFLFVSGFFMSAVRLLCSQAAGLSGAERRTEKLRHVHRAFGQVLCAAALLLPLAWWTLSSPGLATWGLVAGAVILLFWGVDLDMVRATLGRSSLVAPAAAVGAFAAIGCLALFRTPAGALAALLLQWLPLVALQAGLVWRLRRRLRVAMRSVWHTRGRGLPSLMAMALFDGLIINAPFFLDARTPAEVGVSIGVVTRIFVSSLILMPLVMFWSNGRVLSQLGRRLGLTPALMFWAISLSSGTVAGLGLAGCFAWLAGQPPQPAELLAAWLLLFGYSCFATVSRYRGAAGVAGGGRPAWPLLLLLALGNLLVVDWAVATPQPALATALVQAGSLLLAAGLLSVWPRRQRLPSEAP
jgi:hypothetical protein